MILYRKGGVGSGGSGPKTAAGKAAQAKHDSTQTARRDSARAARYEAMMQEGTQGWKPKSRNAFPNGPERNLNPYKTPNIYETKQDGGSTQKNTESTHLKELRDKWSSNLNKQIVKSALADETSKARFLFESKRQDPRHGIPLRDLAVGTIEYLNRPIDFSKLFQSGGNIARPVLQEEKAKIFQAIGSAPGRPEAEIKDQIGRIHREFGPNGIRLAPLKSRRINQI